MIVLEISFYITFKDFVRNKCDCIFRLIAKYLYLYVVFQIS